LDGSCLIAATSFGSIITSDDFGATWRELAGAGVADWTGLASSNGGTVLLAIDADARVLISTDKGTSWQLSLQGTEPVGFQQENAAVRSKFTGIASSSDGSRLVLVRSKGYLYTYAGNVWKRYTEPLIGDWSSVASSNDGVILLAAQKRDESCSPGYLYISQDRGYNWDRIYNAGRGYWSQVVVFENIYIAALQDNAANALWVSIDLGYSWIQPTSVPSSIEPMSAGLWSGLDICRSADAQSLNIRLAQYRKSNGDPGVVYLYQLGGTVDAEVFGRSQGFINSYWSAVALSNECSSFVAVEYKKATNRPGNIYYFQKNTFNGLTEATSAGRWLNC